MGGVVQLSTLSFQTRFEVELGCDNKATRQNLVEIDANIHFMVSMLLFFTNKSEEKWLKCNDRKVDTILKVSTLSDDFVYLQQQ